MNHLTPIYYPMISLKQTNSAALSVQRELFAVGLWYENTKLIKTNVYWSAMPCLGITDALGFFTIGVSFMNKIQGLEEGHIYIPKWVLSQGFNQNRGSLREIIRHEYGHAVAHYYPELIDNSTDFEKVFGAAYYSNEPTGMEEVAYISAYAASMPMEDFAETFMVFVRRKGIVPSKISNKKLLAKWQFLANLCNIISLK